MFDWLRDALQGRFGLFRTEGSKKTKPKKHGDKKNGKKNGKKKTPPVPPPGDGAVTHRVRDLREIARARLDRHREVPHTLLRSQRRWWAAARFAV